MPGEAHIVPSISIAVGRDLSERSHREPQHKGESSRDCEAANQECRANDASRNATACYGDGSHPSKGTPARQAAAWNAM